MPTPTRYLTVVLELPADTASARNVLEALPLFGRFKGARVTAQYASDAITENELLEQLIRPHEMRLIRQQANQPKQATLQA